MRNLQSQAVHHITLLGADRQTSIDFCEGLLGMPFVFEQPNLDTRMRVTSTSIPATGASSPSSPTRSASWTAGARRRIEGACITLRSRSSQATFKQAVERLDERGIRHSGVKDRGFMDSIYFKDPLGLLIELASYRFAPPSAHTHADVLREAHRIRIGRGDHHIAEVHVADAIERLVEQSRESLSEDRAAKDPYR
jgi:catechol 2,3-dioxygenase-like lactoylglutathione lyase family enzyme